METQLAGNIIMNKICIGQVIFHFSQPMKQLPGPIMHCVVNYNVINEDFAVLVANYDICVTINTFEFEYLQHMVAVNWSTILVPYI